MPLTIPSYIEVRTAAGAPVAYLSPEADGLKDCWINNELNGSCTISFSLPIQRTKEVFALTVMGTIPSIPGQPSKWQYLSDSYRIYAGGKEFILLNPDAIEKTRDGKKTWGKITAHESWVRLGKDYVDPGISNDPQTPTAPALAVIIISGGSDLSGGRYAVGSAGHALYAILDGTDWSVGTVDVTGTHDLETEKISRLENINKIQEIWGGYLIWDSVNKTVSLRSETTWAPYTGYQIRYAKNLKGITRTDDYDIITKLYPFGENDLDIGSVNGGVIYLTDNSYTTEVLEGTWINQNISDPQELKDEAAKYLAKVCKPRYNYQVKQVDLRTLSGYQHEDFDLGHMVDVIDEDLGIEIQARIIAYRYNVFQPWQCELEVGDPVEKLESMIVESQAIVKYINDIRTSRNQITAYRLVDESLITKKIAQAAVDATKLNTKTIVLVGDVWTDNMPSGGSVSWNQHRLFYSGTEYIIVAGNSNQKYIYWDGSSGSYSASTSLPNLTDGQFVIAVNNGGLHDTVWDKGYAREFIGSALIGDAAILSAHIGEAQILDAHIAELTANKIKSGQLLTTLVEIVGNNGHFTIKDNGFKAYDQNGELAGYLGWFETLGEQLSIFTRASAAYDDHGNQVASGVERYGYMRYPVPMWQDSFDTDQLSQYTSGGDIPATWTVSNGNLIGSGGIQATLIKNNLPIKDAEIEVKISQSYGGGIIARYQDNANYYCMFFDDDAANNPSSNVVLLKRVNGVFTTLKTLDIDWPRGTLKTFKFTLHGSLLEGYVDNVKVFSVPDSTFSAGGVGLRNYKGDDFIAHDFKVYNASRALMAEESSTNILGADGNFEVDSNADGVPDGWEFYNQPQYLSISSERSWSGTKSIKVDCDNSGGSAYIIPAGWNLLKDATPGKTYTASCKVWIESVVGECYIDLYVRTTDITGNTVITQARAQADKTLTGQWQTLKVTITAATGTAKIRVLCPYVTVYPEGKVVCYYDAVKIEEKPYPTSYCDSIRAGEVLSVPTAGVFNKGGWAVEMKFTPTAPQGIATASLWNCTVGNNYWWIHVNAGGYLRGGVSNNGVLQMIESDIVPQVGQTYSIMLSGDGSIIRFYVNGVQIDSDLPYAEPDVDPPESMCFGVNSTGAYQANGLIGDIRISNRARTLAEHQASYDSGKPLTADEYTTLLMSMDGTLKPTIRKTGLMVKHTGTGDYTELNETGLVRYTAERVYAETPTGVPTGENFEGGSIPADWECSGATVQSTYKHSGTYALKLVDPGYARCYVEITKDCTAEFYYRMDTDIQGFELVVDGVSTVITPAALATWYQHTFTLSKGLHSIEFYNPYNDSETNILYIDDIIWEAAPVTYSVTKTNPGVYENEYLYETYIGSVSVDFMTEASTDRNSPPESAVPDIWVQLPDRFKGKPFTVALAVKEAFATGGSIQKIVLHVVDGSMDYVNARFKVRALFTQYKIMWIPSFGYNEELYAHYGLDFTYMAVV